MPLERKMLVIIAQTLIAIGTPPLFFLKILFWTVVWIGERGFNFANILLKIILGIWETVLFLKETIWSLFSLNLLKLKEIKFKRVKFSIPSFKVPNLPKIELPKFPKLPIPDKIRYFVYGSLAVLLLFFVPYWVKTQINQLPDPHLLAVRDIPVSTKIYDRKGVLLYQIYADENRTLVNLDTLPKYVAEATIAIEDKNFYYHPGFDPLGIVRAAYANVTGQSVQGGSTLTQQLVKSVLLTPERTVARKIKELLLSFWAERLYSKKEILTMYLNQVPYGGAAYGIEAASQTYFKKPAKDLTLAEAALLAGLPSSPTVYSPFTHPELAKQRQEQVLNAMFSQGYITALQKDAAFNEPVKFAPLETPIKAPHFVMFVRDYLINKYGIRTVERGGLNVTTSLDFSLQEAVQAIVSSEVERQKYLNVGNGAALITNPKTGEILTMVGSVDFFDLAHDGNVNVTLSRRSPGSAIKPLNYALALEKGIITPETLLEDLPVVYRSFGGPDYSPRDYDGKFHGTVSARIALASSLNIPAVRVLEKNGVKDFLDFAKKMGITTWDQPDRYGLALTLGGGEVTMMDLATAYGVFANNGIKTDLSPVLKVTDYKNNILEERKNNRTQVISSKTATIISDILADNSARALTFGTNSPLSFPGFTVSVKTGTTEDKRDNWTIGYAPDFLVAVWVGNNDNSPMSPYLESGNTGAAALWHPIMEKLLSTRP